MGIDFFVTLSDILFKFATISDSERAGDRAGLHRAVRAQDVGHPEQARHQRLQVHHRLPHGQETPPGRRQIVTNNTYYMTMTANHIEKC